MGWVPGIYTASMPLFAVEDRHGGTRAFFNYYEGPSRYRLNYGYYSDEVDQNLKYIAEVINPGLADAVRLGRGLPLKPLIQRGLHIGREVHNRNNPATLPFVM